MAVFGSIAKAATASDQAASRTTANATRYLPFYCYVECFTAIMPIRARI